MKFHTLQIQHINRQTDKAVELIFKVPEDLRSEFSYQPGQYLTLQTSIEGEDVRRSYSISSSPDEALSVVVKAIDQGIFSNYVNTQLKPGDSLGVHAPEGNFTLPEEIEDKQFIAFAAGSGITPIMSMIKSVLKQSSRSKFVLVYGNKSPKSSIYLQELLTFQQSYPERFFIESVYSETKEDNAQFGRIETPTINYVIKNKYANFNFNQVYLCGPEPMINNTIEVLKSHKISEENINFELFFSAEDAEVSQNHDGQTQVKVILDDEEFEFSMPKDQKILDAILAQDIDAPYSCQGGICSSCVAKITEGKAEMIKNQILTDEDTAEGLILTCQGLPLSENLTIDYDDV